jgi:hypothetical protein
MRKRMSNTKKKNQKPEASAKEWTPDNKQMSQIQCEEKPKKDKFTGESKK